MKHRSTLYSWMPMAAVGLALSVTVGLSQKPIIVVDTFDNNSTSINQIWNWYGGATYAWDGTQDHDGNGGGSLHIMHPSAAGDDTIIVPETFAALGGGVWNAPVGYDLTTYTNASCWFKWDTNNSTMTIDTFNTQGNGGFSIGLGNTSGNWNGAELPFAQIPDSASNQWVLLNFPINAASISFINSVGLVDYYDWKPAPWSGTVAFWIDDVQFEPSSVLVPPPPTISGPVKAIQGLNIFAGSEGNTYYDRQEVLLKQKTGVSWAGQATAGNPVTYTFTIASFPTNPATYGGEAYFFLCPNPVANDGAGDWNETNVAIAFIQQNSPSNSVMGFQYKVNDDHDNKMYTGTAPYTNAPGSWNGVTTPWYESGNIGSVTNTGSPVGTWSISFTSPTNVLLTAPNGSTSTCVIPPYNASYFYEVSGYNIYLGMQANNAAMINQAVVFSNFSISNTVSVPFLGNANQSLDNFLADSTLNTNWWDTSESTVPDVLVVPSSAKYWIYWTLPAGGFTLESGASLGSLGSWTSPSIYPVLGFYQESGQLVDSTELPAGKTAFFNLVKRTASQLQIILPGETNAPGTAFGKTGSPTAVSLGVDSGYENVTVYAVDSTYHIVSGVGGSVALTTTDPNAVLPANQNMVNGVASFTVGNANPMTFEDVGTWTIMATNQSFSFPAVTSSPVQVTN